MRTAQLQVNGSGVTEQQSLDADEDREIHAVEFFVEGISGGSTSEVEVHAWLGADERVADGSDGVSDSTQLLGSYSLSHFINTESATVNPENVATSFPEPFDWGEHVTLTVEAEISSEQAVDAGAIVYYTEK